MESIRIGPLMFLRSRTGLAAAFSRASSASSAFWAKAARAGSIDNVLAPAAVRNLRRVVFMASDQVRAGHWSSGLDLSSSRLVAQLVPMETLFRREKLQLDGFDLERAQ